MTDTDRLAALLHAEDCWPDCGNPKEVPAGTLFHRMAARLIDAGVTLAAAPAPLDVLVAARAVVDAWEETVTATVISRTNWAIERLRYALAAALDEEPGDPE